MNQTNTKPGYQQQAETAAKRVEWCEKKLSFERKRYAALKDLANNDDWLEGKVSPVPNAGVASLLGHKKIQHTVRYTELSPIRLRISGD